jgi:hypothetical protein
MEEWSLTTLADGLLSQALSTSTGCNMCTVDGERPHLLYQTVVALARGHRIEEHDNASEASVQVLRGWNAPSPRLRRPARNRSQQHRSPRN